MVCDVPSDKSEIRLVLDNNENVFVGWQDFRSGVNQGLYLQKITVSGTLAFGPSGLTISVMGGDQLYPEMISDTQDGIYITWESYIDTAKSDIYCLHVDGEGQLVQGWQTNGNIVSDALFWQLDPCIGPDGDGGCMIGWEDGRSSGKEQTYNLFAQRMNDGTTSDVKEGSASVPSEFRLEQNYPNPFNPDTRIYYSIASPGHVRLAIYDILGRQVNVLQNQIMLGGSHYVTWNGRNLSGDLVASGIYFCSLQVAGHSEVRKMVLLK
jgi:hypothetical protein